MNGLRICRMCARTFITKGTENVCPGCNEFDGLPEPEAGNQAERSHKACEIQNPTARVVSQTANPLGARTAHHPEILTDWQDIAQSRTPFAQ